MSIFKDTFPEEIKKQIYKRQDLLTRRSRYDLSYLNSRKAWVRLTSGVNIIEEKGEGTINDSNTLARQYVLQGGTLNDTNPENSLSYIGTFKQGVGSNPNKAYSTTTPSGKNHKLGIRPMPGITDVNIKSKSAYGSLREATINFICWDIAQLEDLELLYMRPGFTALLEWGWTPYIKNDDSYITTTTTYSDFLLNKTPTGDNALQDIYKILHVTKSLQETNGNYDSLIGYIKNFQWSFRPDGGYDCSTTLISFGEVLESLKINYSAMNISAADKTKGFLGISGISSSFSSNFPKVYDKNKLAGLLYEMSSYMATILEKEKETTNSNESMLGENNGRRFLGSFNGDSYDMFALDLEVDNKNSPNTSDKTNIIQIPSSDRFQYYITLESFCKLLNKYILITSDKGNIVSISTQDREYITKIAIPTTTPQTTFPTYSISPLPFDFLKTPQNIIDKKQGFPMFTGGLSNTDIQIPSDYSKSLLCLIHPLQLSVDPSVCLIKSPVWENGFSFPKVVENITADTPGVVNRESGEGNKEYSNEAANIVQDIIDYVLDGTGDQATIQNNIQSYLNSKPDQEKALQELIIQYEIKRGGIIKISYTPPVQGGQTIIYDSPSKLKSSKNIQAKDIFAGFPSFGEFSQKKLGTSKGKIDFNQIFDILKLDDKTKSNYNTLINNGEFTGVAKTAEKIKAQNDASEKASSLSKTNLKFLKSLLPFFKDDKPDSGLGYISNIYINIEYLYQLSLNQNLESLDKKEKNEINLYDYLKTMIGAVQASIGNINNFDIHVDPIDNIGRIIDINYTSETPDKDYTDATELKIQGTNTTAINVNLQSQIFPEQSSAVAISAQNGGGTLGLDNNTLVGFNQGIRDRILPEKYSSKLGILPPSDINTQLINLTEAIGSLALYINDFKSVYHNSWFSDNEHAKYNTSNANEYKNALRDIINFIKAISNDPNQFKSIIPTKLSVTLDGIGGIVIGNLFKIPDNSLPTGYKGTNNIGRRVGYIVTGLSHKIDTKFWETTIDAQTVILEPNTDKIKFDYNQIIIPDPENLGGFILQTPTVTNNVGSNYYDYSPVAVYYQNKNYSNGYIPNNELIYLNTDDKKSNSKDRLHPTAATQWENLVKAARIAGYSISKFNISYVTGAAYRSYAEQVATKIKHPETAAKAGSSPHGWGGAVDIQQLFSAVRGSGNPTINANVRATNNLYKWLSQNGPTYGWYNPYRLAGGSRTDECWHWEYWGPV